MEFGLSFGEEEDFEGALLAVGQLGSGDLGLYAAGNGVAELERATALNLNAVVKGCAGGQCICAEAGAGVVNLEELDGGSGAILHGDFDVVGAAG